MDYGKLPTFSEQLLTELVQSKTPEELLHTRFQQASGTEDKKLRAVLRELVSGGYLTIQWADNEPYHVTLSNSALTYAERLAAHEAEATVSNTEPPISGLPVIFISHRTEDAEVADMIRDYFVATGIPNEYVFCSSLPGNDVKTVISREVKGKIQNSAVNIAILSRGYYQSAYCLNEAGIFWLHDAKTPVVAIGLPEITHTNMHGFVNSDYKLRRLDNENDISDIYDTVRNAVKTNQVSMAVCTAAGQKLRQRYANFLENRKEPTRTPTTTTAFSTAEITTDDERIVLCYILKKNIRKVSKSSVSLWLNESEIYDVDVDNAFDLLSSLDGGSVVNDTLEFGIEAFRKYSANAAAVLPQLQECVDRHTKLAVNTFKIIWGTDTLDSTMGLFLAYIVDERMSTFGDRWMAEGQIESIKQWESKFSLDDVLSKNYGACLEFLVQNKLVYASQWTGPGNVRQHTLCPSLQEYLFNCPPEVAEELQKVKIEYHFDLPF